MFKLKLIELTSNTFFTNIQEVLSTIDEYDFEDKHFKPIVTSTGVALSIIIESENPKIYTDKINKIIKRINSNYSLKLNKIEEWKVTKLITKKEIKTKVNAQKYMEILANIEKEQTSSYSVVVNYNNEYVFFNDTNKYQSLNNTYIKFSAIDGNVIRCEIMLSSFYINDFEYSLRCIPKLLKYYFHKNSTCLKYKEIIEDLTNNLININTAMTDILSIWQILDLEQNKDIKNDSSLLKQIDLLENKSFQKKGLYFIVLKLLSLMDKMNIKTYETILLSFCKTNSNKQAIRELFRNIRKLRKNMACNYSKYSCYDLFEELYNKLIEIQE